MPVAIPATPNTNASPLNGTRTHPTLYCWTSVEKAPFNLHDFLADLEMMFQSRAEAKGLHLYLERDNNVPASIIADEKKLRQVLVNLLGNAVKFTEEGAITLRVRTEIQGEESQEEGASRRLLFEVEDSGRGISPEYQETIFSAFQQGDANDISGTGLGLAISRRLVHLMGGAITVESTPDKGSRFYFNIPFEATTQKVTRNKKKTSRIIGLKPTAEPIRILIVDDNKVNRLLVRAVLNPLGFHLEEAANGAQALEIFEAWAPHCILMDLRMPVMDGYEAIRRLKATEAGQTTPIIALTASAFVDKEKAVLALGADAYLRKPFQSEELFQLLQRLLRLDFIEEDEQDGRNMPSDSPSSVRDTPCALSQEKVADIRRATEAGDMARLVELIAQVERTDAAQAEVLRGFAERYDYDKLIRWLEAGKEPQ